MQWFNASTPKVSPTHFDEIATETFAKALPCLVTNVIYPDRYGRVKLQKDGISWRAQLYETSCRTRLLPGQAAMAIGRECNTLIVIPRYCPVLRQAQNPAVPISG